VTRHPSDRGLLDELQRDRSVRRIAWFSKAFYAVSEVGPGLRVARRSASTLGQLPGPVDAAETSASGGPARRRALVMTGLRMGETPWFASAFVVRERSGGGVRTLPAPQLPTERVPPEALLRLWRRALPADITRLRNPAPGAGTRPASTAKK